MLELLAQLRIARSSYFYHRACMCLADKYAAVRHGLAEIFKENRRCYGYRRLQASLARKSVIIHSDRGAHYRWPGWLTRISEANLIRSMSRKGCSQDNAAYEGFFGRLKTELFYPRDWKAITIEQFVAEVDAYIRWYNEKRIKISLGSLSPVEYRQSLDLNL